MGLKSAREHQAEQDASRNPALIAHSGTAGTADTLGTAEIVRVGANPTTGALYVQDLAGAAGTSNVSIANGTVTEVSNVAKGTITRVEGGSVAVTSIPQVSVGTIPQVSVGTVPQISVGTLPILNLTTGTITTGSITNLAMLHAGTINTLTSVSNLVKGTITKVEGGTVGEVTLVPTVTTVSNLTSGSVRMTVGTITTGSITDLATVYNLNKGTITKVEGGTVGEVTLVPTVTTLSNLTSGSVRLTVGTITTGSLTDLANVYNGTVRISVGTITTGSITNLASLHTGTIQSVSEVVKGTTTLVSTVTTLSNLTNGSVNILTGTLQSSGTTTGVGVVTSVTNLAAGTVQINPVPVPTMLQHGTLGTAGGSFFATISAASGAGTKHYIQGVDIVMQSGTADVRVLAGSAIQGTGVLAAGQFPAGGGISKNWFPHFATGTGSELIYHFVGAGTAFITVSYWKGA